MKKSNTDDGLMTSGFGRICGVNFLFFAAVYMLLPILPMALKAQADISYSQMSLAYMALWGASVGAGLLSAFLCDTYRRTNVLKFAFVALLASLFAYLYVQSFLQLLVVCVVQGAAFSLAGSAAITVAIDVVPSALRSKGNTVFCRLGRIGMLVGSGIGLCLYHGYGFPMVTYVAMSALVFAILLTMGISLSFRAPVGVPLLSIDRFLLLRAWLPALNLALASFGIGALMPEFASGSWLPLLGLTALAFVAVPMTRMFIKLSPHCQRASANHTCSLAIETGLLSGMAFGYRLLQDSDLLIHSADAMLYRLSASVLLSALLCFVALSMPYFRRKRLR